MNLEEYYNNIYRYCYLHTQNRHTAEDLTQETFLKFLETSNYQDRGKPLAFLYTIARNLCIDHIRQNSKSSDARRRAAESFIPAAEDTELAATSVALSQAVKELSETDREIICLRYVLEMNPGEIGRIMDLHPVSRPGNCHGSRIFGTLRHGRAGTFHAVFPACGPLCKARHPGSGEPAPAGNPAAV